MRSRAESEGAVGIVAVVLVQRASNAASRSEALRHFLISMS